MVLRRITPMETSVACDDRCLSSLSTAMGGSGSGHGVVSVRFYRNAHDRGKGRYEAFRSIRRSSLVQIPSIASKVGRLARASPDGE